MAQKPKDDTSRPPQRPDARLPKGMRDIEAAELRQTQAMLAKIREVYERYGFEPLETPAFEYTDALGKFLPDQDRPNEGVFSFTDEDEKWLSLRYDLTAPLARYVAENFNSLPKPFRRYATGSVWRNEKPGPGRFRQFTQFDADTVGAESVAADAEMCMLAADTLEALGIPRGQYVVKVNSRKVLDGVLARVGIDPSSPQDAQLRLAVLRALDKYDKFGSEGVALLLGEGRTDESGAFTKGAGLESDQVKCLTDFLFSAKHIRGYEIDQAASSLVTGDEYEKGDLIYSNENTITGLTQFFKEEPAGELVVTSLREMFRLLRAAKYGSRRIRFDPSVVRGLEYYTGPVFEAELLIEAKDEKGHPVRFGSVGGGGRYDDLVARFTGQKVPATGFSIGVSRLQAALNLVGAATSTTLGPVVVTVMDKDQLPHYQGMVQQLRQANIRAELYLGNPKKFGRQLEYADKRGSPMVIIQGSNERNAEPPQVIIKDLIEGAKAAAAITDNKEWKEARPAQVSVPEANLVEAVREILARHST
ncbi:MAG: histidine--tRNA ligase [Hyphomicrobium sp.]|jgi:histidyl-tRNA synthetase